MSQSTPVLTDFTISTDLLNWFEAFILDRQSTFLSEKTIEWHRTSLTHFLKFCSSQGIDSVYKISAVDVRKYILYCENKGYKPGGIYAKYSSVRTFFNWLEIELDTSTWSNPIRKIKVKKPNIPPLDPADITAIKAILKECNTPIFGHSRWLGTRDKLIILMLLDTGLRASELLSLTLDNINPITGVIRVLHGKGGKSRTVYIGRKTRQMLRRYLKEAKITDYLFMIEGNRILTYSGLVQMLRNRAKRAGVKYQTAHSFRRLFALTMLRNGVDIYSLQLLMGHADLQVLRRYLKQTDRDTLEAHLKGCPVEKLL